MGVAAEGEEESAPGGAEEEEMAIKLEASDLESRMARAMASAIEARDTCSGSAQVGAATEVNAISVANPLKSPTSGRKTPRPGSSG